MAGFRWIVNAAARTWMSLSVSNATPDDAFAEARLTPGLYRLYLRMDARDRAHAVHVTRALEEGHPDAPRVLVQAALLHDVGKSVRPYRVWERILAHLWAPAGIPPAPRLRGVRGAWQVRMHHGAYGAELVRRAGESEAVARLIAEHDAPDAGPDARKLQRVDDLT